MGASAAGISLSGSRRATLSAASHSSTQLCIVLESFFSHLFLLLEIRCLIAAVRSLSLPARSFPAAPPPCFTHSRPYPFRRPSPSLPPPPLPLAALSFAARVPALPAAAAVARADLVTVGRSSPRGAPYPPLPCLRCRTSGEFVYLLPY